MTNVMIMMQLVIYHNDDNIDYLNSSALSVSIALVSERKNAGLVERS